MVRRPYTTEPKSISVRVAGPWLHDVQLIRDPAGRTFVRVDGEVYNRGAWVNLSLSGGEVEQLYRATQEAERRLLSREVGLHDDRGVGLESRREGTGGPPVRQPRG